MNNKELIENLRQERDRIKDEYVKVIESMDNTINVLESGSLSGGDGKGIDPNYNSNWQWREKITYFLQKEQRFMHNREMSEIVHSLEPGLDTKVIMQKIASVLSRLKNDRVITNIQIGTSRRNTFWGANEWIDANRNILKGHEINRTYLYEKNKVSPDLFTIKKEPHE